MPAEVVGKNSDLNIEEVLEDWEVSHALREVIANAIDEQILTRTDDLRIRTSEAGGGLGILAGA